MKAVTAREANQSFSRWLAEAERGQEILITKRGKPVAKLVPVGSMSEETRRAAAERAIELMRKGLDFGGRRFTRDEMHERELPSYLREIEAEPGGQG